MPERYKNMKFGSLDEYITPAKFRTISERMRSIPLGVSEFAVEIHMKQPIKSKLSFKTPWDGVIYGCARGKNEVRQKLNLDSDVKTAYLVDWDDKFLFLLELENQQEYPLMYVHGEEIINLLENCWRIPEQRIKIEGKE